LDANLADFYAPWCGHCKKLMPEWSEMARNLKGIAKAGSVDATAHKSCTNRHEVRGYPSIKLFMDGGKRVVDFKGTRDSTNMENFVKKMLQPAVTTLKDTAALESFLKENDAAFVLAGEVPSQLEAAFRNASLAYQRDSYFGRLMSLPKGSSAGVLAYSEGELRETHEAESPVTDEGFDTFITDNNIPYVVELAAGSFYRTTHSGRRTVVGVVDPSAQAATKAMTADLRAMAKKTKQYRFGWIDGVKWPEFVEQTSLSPELFPTLMVIDAPQKIHYVHRNASYDRASFVTEVEAGRIEAEGDGASYITTLTNALGGPKSAMIMIGVGVVLVMVMFAGGQQEPVRYRPPPGGRAKGD